MLYKIIIALIFLIFSTNFSQVLYEIKLTPPDGREQDAFGAPVDILGNELIIGATGVDYIQQNNVLQNVQNISNQISERLSCGRGQS